MTSFILHSHRGEAVAFRTRGTLELYVQYKANQPSDQHNKNIVLGFKGNVNTRKTVPSLIRLG